VGRLSIYANLIADLILGHEFGRISAARRLPSAAATYVNVPMSSAGAVELSISPVAAPAVAHCEQRCNQTTAECSIREEDEEEIAEEEGEGEGDVSNLSSSVSSDLSFTQLSRGKFNDNGDEPQREGISMKMHVRRGIKYTAQLGNS
jgi:hypothetical protein